MNGVAIERSTDDGETWTRSIVKPSSAILVHPQRTATYCDGVGNRYRSVPTPRAGDGA